MPSDPALDARTSFPAGCSDWYPEAGQEGQAAKEMLPGEK